MVCHKLQAFGNIRYFSKEFIIRKKAIFLTNEAVFFLYKAHHAFSVEEMYRVSAYISFTSRQFSYSGKVAERGLREG